MTDLNYNRFIDDTLRVTLIDPKTLENYDLYFKLFDVPIARKWATELKKIKKQNYTFREKKVHHKNFKITEETVKKFNKIVRKINAFYDLRLRYPITEINQDILNDLHDAYAIYGVRNHEKLEAKWWDTAYQLYDETHVYAKRWPGITFNEKMHNAFISLNDLIHSAEIALKEDWKDASEFICVASYSPRTDYTLEDEDTFCLKPFLDFGDLCLGYNTLGKSLKHIVQDEDLYSLKKNLIFPQTTWSNEMLIHMCPSDNTPEGFQFYWERWKKLNPEKFGFTYGEFFKNREGYYAIGTLDGKQKEELWTMRHNTMKVDLSRFTDIFDYSIISSEQHGKEYYNKENRKPHWKQLAPMQGKEIVKIENKEFSLVTWILNDICNYSCRYCPSELHDGKNYPLSWEQVEPFINHSIEMLSENDRKIIFSISGGEPTLSPFFPELVKEIHDRGHTTLLTTNLARTERFIEENFKYLLQASCSFHPAFEFKNQTSDTFIEKLKISSRVTRTTVRVMMDPLYWDQCIEFIEQVKTRTNVRIDIVMIEEQYGQSSDKLCEINYSPEQLKFFEDFNTIEPRTLVKYQVNDNFDPLITYVDGTVVKGVSSYQTLINNGQSRFYNWNCSIGSESMFIHQTGDIRKGNCQVGGRTWGKMSEWKEINWGNFKKEIVCTQRSCTCGADIPISKSIRD
jgi:MoaA/NifB/PqqE/SkfB family radical SAM enzyme